MDTTRVYIVRHGETEANKQKIIQGHLDTLLNSEGKRQADLVAEALKVIPFDACFSSDLRRAADTADRILVHHSRVKLQAQWAMREQYMGIVQGHKLEEAKTLLSPERERRVEDEPESPEAAKKRAMAWWNETVVGTTASCVLVVSHGDWIRLLVQGLLEDKAISAAPDVQVEEYLNTAVSIVEIERGRASGKLLQYGNVDHLRDAAMEGNAAFTKAKGGYNK